MAAANSVSYSLIILTFSAAAVVPWMEWIEMAEVGALWVGHTHGVHHLKAFQHLAALSYFLTFA